MPKLSPACITVSKNSQHSNIVLLYNMTDALLLQVKRSNDKIDWLFKESTALFPSIYLLKQHLENPNYVKGRLRESFRVMLRMSQRYGKDAIPIYAYMRSIYMDEPTAYNFVERVRLYKIFT